MKLCTTCGKQLADDVRFCSSCGTALATEEAPKELTPVSEFTELKTVSVAEYSQEQLKAVLSGTEKTLLLRGEKITIPQSLDTYNACRCLFQKMAKECADNAIIEYNATVDSFDAYVDNFLPIYDKYLLILAQNAAQFLMTAGIFTDSAESIVQRQKEVFHLAIDDYHSVLNTYKETVDEGKEITKAFTNATRTFSKNTSTPFESSIMSSLWEGVIDKVYDNIEAKGNASFSKDQKAALFSQFKLENLFNLVYNDYFNMHLTLVWILKQSEVPIYFPEKTLTQKATTIFQNLSSPVFPQEQFLPVCVDMLLAYPYNTEFYDLIEKKIGNKEEVTGLKQYFGLTEYTMTPYTSADFPQATQQNESAASGTAQNGQQANQGFLGNITSAVGNMDKDQIKDSLKNMGKKALSGSLTKGLFGKGFGKK